MSQGGGDGGAIVWFTGLSGAGKSTIASHVFDHLRSRGVKSELLDGDVVRQQLSRGLGYSREDRDENIRRIAFVANLLARNGITALVSAISPYREAREAARRHSESPFYEVHVSASLQTCERRDPKGLYRKARLGELPHFTGIDDPYEVPAAPDLICATDTESVDESVEKVLRMLAPLMSSADLEV
jgi:adenylylsulfate kinase